MSLSRRSFLIGLGSAAVVASALPTFSGNITPSRLFLCDRFDRVNLNDLFLTMRGTDMPNEFVNYTIYRLRGDREDMLLQLALHPLASMRWIARPEASIVITKEYPVRLEIDPCGRHSLVGIQYSVPTKTAVAHFSETFAVRDGKVLTHEIHALNPEYEHLIGQA